jgi:hypothetical protein
VFWRRRSGGTGEETEVEREEKRKEEGGLQVTKRMENPVLFQWKDQD